MFGLRVATLMDVTPRKGARSPTPRASTDKAAWGKPSPWVDYTGPVDGKTVGVAILNHPRASATRRPGTSGITASSPPTRSDGTTSARRPRASTVLPQGESIRFRYRVILHDGDTASADLPAAFQAYANPPKAVID